MMVEELRQEFFQTFPELTKLPKANGLFSADKRYLNELYKKYSDPSFSGNDALGEAKKIIEDTKFTMKENITSMMENREESLVS